MKKSRIIWSNFLERKSFLGSNSGEQINGKNAWKPAATRNSSSNLQPKINILKYSIIISLSSNGSWKKRPVIFCHSGTYINNFAHFSIFIILFKDNTCLFYHEIIERSRWKHTKIDFGFLSQRTVLLCYSTSSQSFFWLKFGNTKFSNQRKFFFGFVSQKLI